MVEHFLLVVNEKRRKPPNKFGGLNISQPRNKSAVRLAAVHLILTRRMRCSLLIPCLRRIVVDLQIQKMYIYL